MKLYRNALILLVVLGLLIGSYFFINSRKSSGDSGVETGESATKVMSVEKDDITSLEYNNPDGKFTLKFDGKKTWTIEPAMEFPIYYNAANGAAIDMSSIVADKVIEEKATDFSKYGLDKPSTVTIVLKNGTKKVVEIGSKSPTNEGIYVKMQGENKVYLVNSYYFDKLLLKRSKLLITDILSAQATDIKKYKISKNGVVQFAIDINSEQDVQVTEPLAEKAEPTKITPIIQGLVGLKMTDIADENPSDLSKYGLDKPAYTIEYATTAASIKLDIGKDIVKGSTAYAKFVNGKGVFILDTSPLTFLDLTLKDVLDTFVYLPNIADVNKIELNFNNKNVVCDIAHSADNKNETFKVDGKDANMKDASDNYVFRNFYQAIVGATMNQYDPQQKPSGAPEITIKYTLKDSKVVTVTFVSKDNNYYYALKDGVYTGRIILKSKFTEGDGMIPAYNKLVEEMNKK